MGKPEIWNKKLFLYFLAQSVLSGLFRVVVGFFLKQFYRLTGFLWNNPPCLREGMTASFLTSNLQRMNLLSSDNEIESLEWKSIQNGAIGSVFRVTFNYLRNPSDCKSPSSGSSPSSGATAHTPPTGSAQKRRNSKNKAHRATSTSELVTMRDENGFVYSSHPHTRTPKTAIVKCSGEKLNQLLFAALVELTDRENKIINVLRNRCQLHTVMPKIYGSGYNSTGLLCYAMEDYGELRQLRSVHGAEVADANLMMKTIGKIHRLTWNNKDLFAEFRFSQKVQWIDLGFPVWADKAKVGRMKHLFEIPTIKYVLDALMDIDKMNYMLLAIRGYGVGESSTSQPDTCVLTHSDFRLDNCFFDDVRQECLVVDWQVCSPRHPVVDLAWILGEVKLEHLSNVDAVNQLLQTYVDTLNCGSINSNAAAMQSNNSSPVRRGRRATSSSKISTAKLIEMLPLGCMNCIYIWVIITLGLVDDNVAEIMTACFARMDILLKTFGLPKFPSKKLLSE